MVESDDSDYRAIFERSYWRLTADEVKREEAQRKKDKGAA